MHRLFQMGSVLLLVAGSGLATNQNTQKAPPPKAAANAVAAKAVQPAPGIPKAGIPKGGARVVNPASIAARLFRMTPEEREQQIEKLPNEQRREQLRKQLAWFDGLPKEAQEVQLRRLDRVAQLAPEKRMEVQGLIRQLNELPQPRRGVVQRALYQLQEMNDRQREDTLHRPAFQSRFSPDELKVISGLADAWMGPIY